MRRGLGGVKLSGGTGLSLGNTVTTTSTALSMTQPTTAAATGQSTQLIPNTSGLIANNRIHQAQGRIGASNKDKTSSKITNNCNNDDNDNDNNGFDMRNLISQAESRDISDPLNHPPEWYERFYEMHSQRSAFRIQYSHFLPFLYFVQYSIANQSPLSVIEILKLDNDNNNNNFDHNPQIENDLDRAEALTTNLPTTTIRLSMAKIRRFYHLIITIISHLSHLPQLTTYLVLFNYYQHNYSPNSLSSQPHSLSIYESTLLDALPTPGLNINPNIQTSLTHYQSTNPQNPHLMSMDQLALELFLYYETFLVHFLSHYQSSPFYSNTHPNFDDHHAEFLIAFNSLGRTRKTTRPPANLLPGTLLSSSAPTRTMVSLLAQQLFPQHTTFGRIGGNHTDNDWSTSQLVQSVETRYQPNTFQFSIHQFPFLVYLQQNQQTMLTSILSCFTSNSKQALMLSNLLQRGSFFNFSNPFRSLLHDQFSSIFYTLLSKLHSIINAHQNNSLEFDYTKTFGFLPHLNTHPRVESATTPYGNNLSTKPNPFEKDVTLTYPELNTPLFGVISDALLANNTQHTPSLACGLFGLQSPYDSTQIATYNHYLPLLPSHRNDPTLTRRMYIIPHFAPYTASSPFYYTELPSTFYTRIGGSQRNQFMDTILTVGKRFYANQQIYNLFQNYCDNFHLYKQLLTSPQTLIKSYQTIHSALPPLLPSRVNLTFHGIGNKDQLLRHFFHTNLRNNPSILFDGYQFTQLESSHSRSLEAALGLELEPGRSPTTSIVSRQMDQTVLFLEALLNMLYDQTESSNALNRTDNPQTVVPARKFPPLGYHTGHFNKLDKDTYAFTRLNSFNPATASVSEQFLNFQLHAFHSNPSLLHEIAHREGVIAPDDIGEIQDFVSELYQPPQFHRELNDILPNPTKALGFKDRACTTVEGCMELEQLASVGNYKKRNETTFVQADLMRLLAQANKHMENDIIEVAHYWPKDEFRLFTGKKGIAVDQPWGLKPYNRSNRFGSKEIPTSQTYPHPEVADAYLRILYGNRALKTKNIKTKSSASPSITSATTNVTKTLRSKRSGTTNSTALWSTFSENDSGIDEISDSSEDEIDHTTIPYDPSSFQTIPTLLFTPTPVPTPVNPQTKARPIHHRFMNQVPAFNAPYNVLTAKRVNLVEFYTKLHSRFKSFHSYYPVSSVPIPQTNPQLFSFLSNPLHGRNIGLAMINQTSAQVNTGALSNLCDKIGMTGFGWGTDSGRVDTSGSEFYIGWDNTVSTRHVPPPSLTTLPFEIPMNPITGTNTSHSSFFPMISMFQWPQYAHYTFQKDGCTGSKHIEPDNSVLPPPVYSPWQKLTSGWFLLTESRMFTRGVKIGRDEGIVMSNFQINSQNNQTSAPFLQSQRDHDDELDEFQKPQDIFKMTPDVAYKMYDFSIIEATKQVNIANRFALGLGNGQTDGNGPWRLSTGIYDDLSDGSDNNDQNDGNDEKCDNDNIDYFQLDSHLLDDFDLDIDLDLYEATLNSNHFSSAEATLNLTYNDSNGFRQSLPIPPPPPLEPEEMYLSSDYPALYSQRGHLYGEVDTIPYTLPTTPITTVCDPSVDFANYSSTIYSRHGIGKNDSPSLPTPEREQLLTQPLTYITQDTWTYLYYNLNRLPYPHPGVVDVNQGYNKSLNKPQFGDIFGKLRAEFAPERGHNNEQSANPDGPLNPYETFTEDHVVSNCYLFPTEPTPIATTSPYFLPNTQTPPVVINNTDFGRHYPNRYDLSNVSAGRNPSTQPLAPTLSTRFEQVLYGHVSWCLRTSANRENMLLQTTLTQMYTSLYAETNQHQIASYNDQPPATITAASNSYSTAGDIIPVITDDTPDPALNRNPLGFSHSIVRDIAQNTSANFTLGSWLPKKIQTYLLLISEQLHLLSGAHIKRQLLTERHHAANSVYLGISNLDHLLRKNKVFGLVLSLIMSLPSINLISTIDGMDSLSHIKTLSLSGYVNTGLDAIQNSGLTSNHSMSLPLTTLHTPTYAPYPQYMNEALCKDITHGTASFSKITKKQKQLMEDDEREKFEGIEKRKIASKSVNIAKCPWEIHASRALPPLDNILASLSTVQNKLFFILARAQCNYMSQYKVWFESRSANSNMNDDNDIDDFDDESDFDDGQFGDDKKHKKNKKQSKKSKTVPNNGSTLQNKHPIDIENDPNTCDDPQYYFGKYPGLSHTEWFQLSKLQLLVRDQDGFGSQLRELIEQGVVITLTTTFSNDIGKGTKTYSGTFYTIPKLLTDLLKITNKHAPITQ